MSSNINPRSAQPFTADKLEVLSKKVLKLSEDLGNNGSRRDEEISSSLFTINSIIFKMIQATNRNDIDSEQRIAVRLYEFYQTQIKEI